MIKDIVVRLFVCVLMLLVAPFAQANATTIYLTSGSTWTVPSDWNSSNNTIEAIGAGAAAPAPGANNGAGGGGAYAKITNWSGSGVVPIQIGVAGGTAGSGTGPTANTWFGNGSTLVAAGGFVGAAGAMTGGAGGLVANSVGSMIYPGGAGGDSCQYSAFGGGGGAGGPNGAGAGGSTCSGINGGGGGQSDGSAGGAGGSAGAGGNGGNGANGIEWSASYGAGGGGGGGYYTAGGGNGGAYGGGGGAGYSGIGAAGGGLIVITYSSSNGPKAPSITTQPSPATVAVGRTATFTVAATGSDPLSYQWRKNGVAILRATSSSYTTPSTALTDNGSVFSVTVTNYYGSVTSTNAALFVTASMQPPAQALAAGLKTLAFDDEMTSNNINPNGNGKWYNGIWYEGPSSAANFVYGNGGLTINAPAGAWGDSSLTTLNPNLSLASSTTFLGPFYAETNMSWDGSLNNWAAFWFLAAEHAQGNDGGNWCELDAFEAFPDSPAIPGFAGTVHWWENGATSQIVNSNNYQFPSYAPPANNIYGVLMTSSTITWYLNNVALMSWPTPPGCLTQHMFMILGQQFHSDPNANGVSLTTRWVRVWQ